MLLVACRFCFFDKAVQVDNGGGHETSLGLWKGFERSGSEVGGKWWIGGRGISESCQGVAHFVCCKATLCKATRLP